MKLSADTTFTFGERALAGLGLAIAAPGILNWALWHRPLFGLTDKQIAVLTVIPLFLIVYYVPLRAESRRGK